MRIMELFAIIAFLMAAVLPAWGEEKSRDAARAEEDCLGRARAALPRSGL